MTADDARQARIESARKVIHAASCERWPCLAAARALDAAGMLADPADRTFDEQVRTGRLNASDAQLARGYHGLTRKLLDERSEWTARAERAEAELEAWRATVQRCKALADEWERIDSTPAQWATARLRAALDSEGGK